MDYDRQRFWIQAEYSAVDLKESLLQTTFDERTVDYEFNELDEITLAYATQYSQGTRFRISGCDDLCRQFVREAGAFALSFLLLFFQQKGGFLVVCYGFFSGSELVQRIHPEKLSWVNLPLLQVVLDCTQSPTEVSQ